MRQLFIAVVLLGAAAGASRAQVVGVFSDVNGTDPIIDVASPGLVSLYFVVPPAASGYTAVQFAAPFPTCFEGASYLSDSAVFGVTIGDSQTGVSIGFGSCLSTPIHVLTVNAFASLPTTNTSCCLYDVLPHPETSSGSVQFVDCASNIVAGGGAPGFIGGWAPPLITDRTPPDGAASQPLNTTLAWDRTLCSAGLGVYWNDVYFGTAADPPLVSPPLYEGLSWDPGSLIPSTTYYWKVVGVDSDAGSTTSEVWSFTTEASVAATPATWGQIKSLYE